MPWPLYFSPEKQHIFIDFIGNRSFKLPVYSQIFFNVKIILNYYMIEMISTWFQPFHQSEARALKRRFKLFKNRQKSDPSDSEVPRFKPRISDLQNYNETLCEIKKIILQIKWGT